jgi:HlyD family secretion protein
MKRWLILLAACHGASVDRVATETQRFATVAKGTITERVLVTGELHAASAEDINVPRTDTWQISIKWMAEDGVQVKAGERVLEFDNSAFTASLDTKRLALREAEMAAAGARDLSAIETQTKDVELRQHQIAFAKAKIKSDVPADLLAAREVQERQLATRRAQVALDKAELDLVAQKQEANLDQQVKSIEVEKAKRVIDAAEKSIGELVVTAPRDGVLVIDNHPWEGRKYIVGDMVEPGMTIMSLPDLSKGMEVRAELSDVDDGRVSVGETGTCTLDAYPGDAIPCKVDALTPVARPKAGKGSLRRAFALRLSLGKSDAHMVPGMSVKVELPRIVDKDVLVVPRGAVLPSGATLGACDEQVCAVKGLAEGQRVEIK